MANAILYSFINDKDIVNHDCKALFDSVRASEDQMEKKLSVTVIKRLKKKYNKENMSDEEIKQYILNEMRNIKKTLEKLDKKLETSFDYQSKIVGEMGLTTNDQLVSKILQERKEYNQYIEKYLPVDIRKFQRYDEEYNEIRKLSLPFIEVDMYTNFKELGEYIVNYNDLMYKLKTLEDKYTIIYINSFNYDNYFIVLEESKYFTLQNEHYGKMGMYYYKNNIIIEEKEYNEARKKLAESLQRSHYKETFDYNYLNQNNYSFLMVKLGENKPIQLKTMNKHQTWIIIIDQERIVIYNDKLIVILPKTEFTYYRLSGKLKGPIYLEIEDINKLGELVEEYSLYFQYTRVTGIKENWQGILKRKVGLKMLSIERKYDFRLLTKIENNNDKRIEIDYIILEELQKQKEGVYELSIVNKKFRLVKAEKNELIELDLLIDGKLEPINIYLEKIKIRFDKKEKYYIILTEESLLVTDLTYYQSFSILLEDEEIEENEENEENEDQEEEE